MTVSTQSGEGKRPEQFRDYAAQARACVKEFYRLNHTRQTLEAVLGKKRQYLSLNRAEMGVWEAMGHLNALVDDSDPDIDVPQIEHNLQTAESIRAAGHPRWFILAGLVHDLGKVLCLFGDNPDVQDPRYRTPRGIYEEGCGLDRVHFSWGHDEYLYHVVKDYLPEEALYMIRYHSAYAIHRERAYQHLMSEHDREMFRWVRAFNPHDLYSKAAERPDVAALKPFYADLVAEFFPAKLRW